MLIGYYNPGDKPLALYTWVPSDSRSDDGGLVINPNGNPGNGRWVLATQGQPFNVLDWGADPTDTTASSSAFTNWFAALMGQSAEGYIPAGHYKFASQQTWNISPVASTGVTIKGAVGALVRRKRARPRAQRQTGGRLRGGVRASQLVCARGSVYPLECCDRSSERRSPKSAVPLMCLGPASIPSIVHGPRIGETRQQNATQWGRRREASLGDKSLPLVKFATAQHQQPMRKKCVSVLWRPLSWRSCQPLRPRTTGIRRHSS